MSLQGSLETVGLPDVLNLLSGTAKSGELEVSGSRRGGRLWFAGGKLSGFAVGRTLEAIDAVFELLRVTSGSFSFDETRSAPDPATPVAVAPILVEATARLSEWREIEAVVPSLEAMLELVSEPTGEVVLAPAQWTLAVAIGDGRPVGAVLERRKLGEFDGCKAVKGLIDAGLARVAVEPVAPPRSLMANRPARRLPGDDAGAANGAGGAEGAGNESSERPGAASEVAETDDAAAFGATMAKSGPTKSGVTLAGREQSAGGAAPSSESKRPTKRPAGQSKDEVLSPTPVSALAAVESGEGGAHFATDETPPEMSDDDGDEPLNRGLLLKFLSSVRT